MSRPNLPKHQDCHELWSKKRRKQQHSNEAAQQSQANTSDQGTSQPNSSSFRPANTSPSDGGPGLRGSADTGSEGNSSGQNKQHTIPEDNINALCFSPNRYWLCAATGNSIKIWDLEHKIIVDELKAEVTSPKSRFVPQCVSLAWSAA